MRPIPLPSLQRPPHSAAPALRSFRFYHANIIAQVALTVTAATLRRRPKMMIISGLQLYIRNPCRCQVPVPPSRFQRGPSYSLNCPLRFPHRSVLSSLAHYPLPTTHTIIKPLMLSNPILPSFHLK